MQLVKRVAGALLIGAIAARSGTAQIIDYSTQGFFSGPGTTTPGVICTTLAASTAACSGDGFALTFFGTNGVNLANNTIASLGSFNLVGTGNTTVPVGAVFFTIIVNQTSPTTGSGTFLGLISGVVSTVAGNFSSLKWTPNQTVFVNPVSYQLVFDNVGPAANIGLGIPIDNTRGIDALVTVTSTPEPGTIPLFTTGLLGLGVIAVRRRKNDVG